MKLALLDQDTSEEIRQRLPELAAGMTQVVIDNPGPIILVGASAMVAARVAANLMKPRTPGEAIALLIVLNVGASVLTAQAVRKGWLRFKVRDAAGCLVPLEIPKAS